MNLETYNSVLSKKGGKPDTIRSGKKRGISQGEIAFKKDLLRNKIVWYNNFTDDWHCFLKNYHELYSICKTPKQHPYSRKERFIVFLCNLALSCIIGIVVAVIIKEISDPKESNGVADSKEGYKDAAEAKALNAAISVPFGILKSFINGILKFIAICPCCQTNSASPKCRSFCERIGHCLIFIWLVALIVCVVIVLIVAAGEDRWEYMIDFGFSFAVSNVSSWITSFLILSLCFRIKWKKQKKPSNASKLERFKVSYIDYEKYEKGIDHDVDNNTNNGKTNTKIQLQVQKVQQPPVQVVVQQGRAQQVAPQQVVIQQQQQKNQSFSTFRKKIASVAASAGIVDNITIHDTWNITPSISNHIQSSSNYGNIVYRSTSSKWVSVFGNTVVNKGEHKRWNIKILPKIQIKKDKDRIADIVIGICDAAKVSKYNKKTPAEFWLKPLNGSGYYGYNGKIFRNKKKGQNYNGTTFQVNDIITIEIKNNTLGFYKNNEYLGIAYSGKQFDHRIGYVCAVGFINNKYEVQIL